MLTNREKAILEENIYRMVKESIFENGYFENAYYEGGHKDMDNRSEPDSDKDDSGKRESVMKWLDSAQELHSVLSYELWPDKDEDSARSLFSKKYRGEDNNGKRYEFDPQEINRLYNLRGDFISDAGLD